jgi:hypothetical protein
MMPIVPSAVIISRQVIATSSRRIMRFPPRPHAAASAVAKRCLMAPTASSQSRTWPLVISWTTAGPSDARSQVWPPSRIVPITSLLLRRLVISIQECVELNT